MTYNYQTFLRPIYSNSKNIQILNSDGDLVYTIVPDSVSNSKVSNNLLKITLKSNKILFLDFSTKSNADSAKIALDIQISILSGLSISSDDFDYTDFLVPLTSSSANIQVKNTEGVVVYTINPNAIKDVKINNQKI